MDVVIIGAGASGLAAAAELARRGRSALLIDARERIGGRVWSHQEPGLPVPVELGAEFIHGHADAVFSLLGKAATAAVDRGGEHWTLRDGKLAPSKDLFTQIRVAMKRTRALKEKDMSFDVFVERHLRKELTDEASAYALMLAQGFDAADTSRASARAIVEEWAGGASVEGPQYRPLGGYGALLTHLAGELRGSSVEVQLNTVVRAVKWSRVSVTVAGTFLGQPFEVKSKRAIVALPLGVLQLSARAQGAVRFTPALTAKRDALKHLAPGPVIKVLLRYRKAFWQDLDQGRYRDVDFFHDRQAAFPTFWTALPVRTPLLVAWAAGPKAMRLADASKAEIVEQALRSLSSTFSGRADREIESMLEGAWLHDWQSDPFARGAYSYVTVGGDKAREQLAAPLGNTLFFAGEAADTEDAGTVAGALNSGMRAAREVAASLRS
jgi:monoamine oxidase